MVRNCLDAASPLVTRPPALGAAWRAVVSEAARDCGLFGWSSVFSAMLRYED